MPLLHALCWYVMQNPDKKMVEISAYDITEKAKKLDVDFSKKFLTSNVLGKLRLHLPLSRLNLPAKGQI